MTQSLVEGLSAFCVGSASVGLFLMGLTAVTKGMDYVLRVHRFGLMWTALNLVVLVLLFFVWVSLRD